MQSTFQFIFSGCVGVMLVLASCVLVAPVSALLVAIACVSGVWALSRPHTAELRQTHSRGGRGSRFDGGALAGKGAGT